MCEIVSQCQKFNLVTELICLQTYIIINKRKENVFYFTKYIIHSYTDVLSVSHIKQYHHIKTLSK